MKIVNIRLSDIELEVLQTRRLTVESAEAELAKIIRQEYLIPLLSETDAKIIVSHNSSITRTHSSNFMAKIYEGLAVEIGVAPEYLYDRIIICSNDDTVILELYEYILGRKLTDEEMDESISRFNQNYVMEFSIED